MEDFKYNLYSYRFKKIGFVLLIISIIIFSFDEFLSIPIWEYLSIKQITFDNGLKYSLLIALFFIAHSKDKDEDEMSIYIRMNALSRIFGFSILFYIYNSLINSPLKEINAFDLIVFLHMVYIMGYSLNKWKAKRTEKRNAEAE